MKPRGRREVLVAVVGALGLAAAMLLPWLGAGHAYLHAPELAISQVPYEVSLAFLVLLGLVAGLTPLVRPAPASWHVARMGGWLAAAGAARPVGFVLARWLDAEPGFSLGPGALAALAAGLVIVASVPVPGNPWLAIAGTLLVGAGLVPLGQAHDLHADEWTVALAAPGSTLADASALHSGAVLAALFGLTLAAASAVGSGPGWRHVPASAAGLAALALSILAGTWWARHSGLGIPLALFFPGLAGAAVAATAWQRGGPIAHTDPRGSHVGPRAATEPAQTIPIPGKPSARRAPPRPTPKTR